MWKDERLQNTGILEGNILYKTAWLSPIEKHVFKFGLSHMTPPNYIRICVHKIHLQEVAVCSYEVAFKL